MVILARIDDRLIHGQVVEGWVNHLKATCIMVADDAVAVNPRQRSIMEISAPEGLTVVIGTVEDICGRLRTPDFDRERVIVLFSRPADALRSLQAGMRCPGVNIGGMRFVPGKRKLLDVLAVDDQDLAAFGEILRRGVKVEVQTVPSGKPQPLERLIRA